VKVVVTGATGHLGRYVVPELARAGHEVVAVSRSGRLPDPPFGASESFRAVRALGLDLTSDAAVPVLAEELGREVALVHLAALHPPNTAGTGAAERQQLLAVNVHGTMRALEAARAAGGVAVAVYASSFEVYGEVAEVPVTEQARLLPITDYGATKLAGEDHLIAFGFEEKVRVVALRLPAIYGPGETTRRALPNFVAAVARGQVPEVFGDGGDLRDQIHARDAAKAFRLALSQAGAEGIYNVSDGERHAVGALATLALRLARIDASPTASPREKPRRDYHMSIARARRELGFEPSVKLQDGMAEELDWLKRGTA
jgi:nucleoside-diphosphate-sugar epimerase